jgi:hypothetical protein
MTRLSYRVLFILLVLIGSSARSQTGVKSMDVSSLPRGSYYLKVSAGDTERSVVQFEKM